MLTVDSNWLLAPFFFSTNDRKGARKRGEGTRYRGWSDERGAGGAVAADGRSVLLVAVRAGRHVVTRVGSWLSVTTSAEFLRAYFRV